MQKSYSIEERAKWLIEVLTSTNPLTDFPMHNKTLYNWSKQLLGSLDPIYLRSSRARLVRKGETLEADKVKKSLDYWVAKLKEQEVVSVSNNNGIIEEKTIFEGTEVEPLTEEEEDILEELIEEECSCGLDVLVFKDCTGFTLTNMKNFRLINCGNYVLDNCSDFEVEYS